MIVCMNCVPPKRHPGCHDHCPERQEELKAMAYEKAMIKKNQWADYEYSDYSVRRIERARKRTRE